MASGHPCRGTTLHQRVGERPIALFRLTGAAARSPLDDDRTVVLEKLETITLYGNAERLTARDTGSWSCGSFDSGSPFSAVVVIAGAPVDANALVRGERLPQIIDSGAFGPCRPGATQSAGHVRRVPGPRSPGSSSSRPTDSSRRSSVCVLHRRTGSARRPPRHRDDGACCSAWAEGRRCRRASARGASRWSRRQAAHSLPSTRTAAVARSRCLSAPDQAQVAVTRQGELSVRRLAAKTRRSKTVKGWRLEAELRSARDRAWNARGSGRTKCDADSTSARAS